MGRTRRGCPNKRPLATEFLESLPVSLPTILRRAREWRSFRSTIERCRFCDDGSVFVRMEWVPFDSCVSRSLYALGAYPVCRGCLHERHPREKPHCARCGEDRVDIFGCWLDAKASQIFHWSESVADSFREQSA